MDNFLLISSAMRSSPYPAADVKNTKALSMRWAAYILVVLSLSACSTIKKIDSSMKMHADTPRSAGENIFTAGSGKSSGESYLAVLNPQIEKKDSTLSDYTDLTVRGTARWITGPSGFQEEFDTFGLVEFELLDANGLLVANLESTFSSAGKDGDISKIVPNEPFPFEVTKLMTTELARKVVSCRFKRYINR